MLGVRAPTRCNKEMVSPKCPAASQNHVGQVKDIVWYRNSSAAVPGTACRCNIRSVLDEPTASVMASRGHIGRTAGEPTTLQKRFVCIYRPLTVQCNMATWTRRCAPACMHVAYSMSHA